MSTIRLRGARSIGWTGAGAAICVLMCLASGDTVGGRKREARAATRGADHEDLARVEPFEMQLLKLINEERKHHGVPSLKLDPELSNVARAHSREMRDKRFFGHISPVPAHSTPRKRYQGAFDREPYIIGENVGRRAGTQWSLTEDRIEKTHRGLMDSASHRENILNREFQHVGIGIVINEGGDYWVTELFVGERPSERKKGSAGKEGKKR